MLLYGRMRTHSSVGLSQYTLAGNVVGSGPCLLVTGGMGTDDGVTSVRLVAGETGSPGGLVGVCDYTYISDGAF